jgi:glutamine synthetase
VSDTGKFIERHGLYSPAQAEAARRSKNEIEQHGIELIRLVWPDQYGLIRGKSLTRRAFFSALDAGNEITMAPFFFDTASAIVLNPFTPDGGFAIEGMGGSPNVTAVPDPDTLTLLPWAPKTALVFADLYMNNGKAFPLAPRTILKHALHRLAEQNLKMIAGIEIEWYLTEIVDDLLGRCSLGGPGSPADPPQVAPVARGWSYLLLEHLDQIDSILAPIREAVTAMGLPLRSFDDEWAPSQVETTFDVLEGMAVADSASLFKMAAKQVARRHGYLASFMTTPAIEGFYASGWHLHSSIADATTGRNLMVPGDGEVLSPLGQHYVGGTLAHGIAASAFATQTINGYRRRRPYSLAPDRLTWALDNRAAMMRVISAPGDSASHVENRVGEAAANPYLYLAAQAAAGLDGILNQISPGPISEDPYSSEVAQLPTTLGQALDALAADDFYREQFGTEFIDYFVTIKRSEVNRFEAWQAENPDAPLVNGITEWEHREYFELF